MTSINTSTPAVPSEVRPGDVLLYKPSSVFGWLIRVKTWHPVSHVEMYLGEGISAASRDGQGVARYPFRTDGLIHILRPNVPLDLSKVSAYVDAMNGTPYGWYDLANFAGFNVNAKGIVCSPFVTNALRAGGVKIFNDEPANDIAPFQFLTSELLTEIPLAS